MKGVGTLEAGTGLAKAPPRSFLGAAKLSRSGRERVSRLALHKSTFLHRLEMDQGRLLEEQLSNDASRLLKEQLLKETLHAS